MSDDRKDSTEAAAGEPVASNDILSKAGDLLRIAGRCAGKLKASLTRGEISPRVEFEQLAEKYSEIMEIRSALRSAASSKPEMSPEKVWPVPLTMDHGHIVEHAVELRFESEEDADQFFSMYSAAMGNTAPPAASGQKLTDWRDVCAVLIDIYDDAMNNAPEDRCYIDGAWKEELDKARTLLASSATASDKEGA